ncbi:MAG: secondary thiamine-phosphate synthase enzyme YjbQ [Spirochaetia bacterium]
MVVTETIELESEGNFHTMNVTEQVRDVVRRAGVREGSALVFYRHTTGAVLAVEHEIGLLADLEELFDRLAPMDADWKHHRRGYDANGGAHIRTAFLNPSITVPVVDGELLLGTYQEILIADFDPLEEVRTRKLVVQVAGE